MNDRPERKKIAAPVLEAGIALAAVAAATALAYVLSLLLPVKSPIYPFLFVLAIIAAASRGYVAGLLACLLSFFVAPFVLMPNFSLSSINPTRFFMTLAISVLISAVVTNRQRSENALRLSNEDLDARIRERTAALEEANKELLRGEDQLKLTTTHLNDVLDSVSESFLALDRNWRFTYANRRILQSTGFTPEQVIGKVIWDVFPDAVHTDFYPQYHRVMQERVAVRFEMEYPASGTWFDVTAHPTKEGLSAFVADITQRKKDEASAARLASIVESSSDAIIAKDLNGVILSWNKGAERIYGFTQEEAVGQSIQISIPDSHRGEEAQILERLRRGELVDHFETVRVRKDGARIHVSLTVSPVRNREGQIIGASHIARDITDQKNFNTQLQQVQRLESLGVLAGGIAHDFNNLLVGIIGNASLALESAGPENRPLLEEVLSGGQRAADLTSQMLAYAGKGRFFIQPIDLSGLVSEILRLIHASVPSSVELKLDLANGLPPVEGDSGQIQQIVMNLVINAAEAIGERSAGTVTVITSLIDADRQSLVSSLGGKDLKPGRYVSLEVRDTGCGMDEETVSRIFEPFFTTKFTGRGLGLSAVLGIVGSHKGAMSVRSEPGKGSTFRVLLPVAESSVPAPRPVEVPAVLTGSGSVLVVDDEEVVRKVARNCLKRFGYSVLEAADGQIAADLLRANPADISLVILDLTMPVMGGEEALGHLREIRKDIPVILSSGYSEMEALRRFEGKNITGFLQKPYTASELAAKIKAALPGVKPEPRS